MDHSVKITTRQREAKKFEDWKKSETKIGRRVRQGCCLSPVLFNLYSEYLTQEALEVETSQ
jgi:hypothetical protein